MFEPTCQWFVILNTIVLNFKRWTFIQKALQALSLFCIPWIENSVIFWIDLDVWDLTKFPPKKPNWQGAIYFVCCFFMFCFLTTAPYYSKFWIYEICGRIDINTYLSISMRQFMKIICLLQSLRLTTTLGGLVMVRSKPSTKAAGSRILAYKHLWCHYSKWVLNNVIYTAICHTSRSLETTSRLIIWLYHSATVHSGFHKKLF